jgi:hypothetical protein
MKLCSMAVGLSVLLAYGGCGGRGAATARLEGTITVNGQPVTKGIVSFAPLKPDHGRGSTATIVDGRYSVRDAPTGKVRVSFHAVKDTGRTVTQFGKPYPEVIDIIPDKYRAGLEIEVGGDMTNQDFNL